MGDPRVMPSAKAKVRAIVPVDMTGMDPEMASTMAGETARVMKQKAAYAPASLGKPAVVAPKKKTNPLQDFIHSVWGH